MANLNLRDVNEEDFNAYAGIEDPNALIGGVTIEAEDGGDISLTLIVEEKTTAAIVYIDGPYPFSEEYSLSIPKKAAVVLLERVTDKELADLESLGFSLVISEREEGVFQVTIPSKIGGESTVHVYTLEEIRREYRYMADFVSDIESMEVGEALDVPLCYVERIS